MKYRDFPELLPLSHKLVYKEKDFWVWCGSAIADPNGGYHLYASRWRRDYPMYQGYILFSEIVHAFAENISSPCRFVEKILPDGKSGSWDSKMAHNPSVVKYGDKYLLYYIGLDYDFAPPPAEDFAACQLAAEKAYWNIRIGVAISDSPGGPWRRASKPILAPRSGKWDGKLVTNPAPCVLPDGRIYLYYRANTPEGLRIGLAAADSPEGDYSRFDRPVLNFYVEDPFVWHNGKYFEMLAKDMDGSITGELHAGAHFVSDDGIDWKFQKIAYSRSVVYEDGTKFTFGALERPQLLFRNGAPEALLVAAADGPGGFRNAENTWNQLIKLKP